jgi:hypothetical protein
MNNYYWLDEFANMPNCLRCMDTRWLAVGRGQAVPCPDCQPGAAVLALKRGHRR